MKSPPARTAPASIAAAALLAIALALTGCTTGRAPPRADLISLGRDKLEGQCVATRGWKDKAVPDPFAASWFVTCRGSTTARPLGALRIVEETAEAMKPIDANLDCGADVPTETAAGPARMRRCHDRALGADTVRLDVALDRKHRLIASGVPGLLGPIEEGMAILAGKPRTDASPTREVSSSIDFEAAPKAPEQEAVEVAANSLFDPASVLARGISLNRRGLYLEASRVLNDALSRIPADADAGLRVQLLLEAGLADSNISFAKSAADHFAEADTLMDKVPAADAGFLSRKQSTYAALDLLNRRQFDKAEAVLDKAAAHGSASQAFLRDPATLRGLNQGAATGNDAADAISVPNSNQLLDLVLDAQANWARSVVHLAKGDPQAANRALRDAVRDYAALYDARVSEGSILWLAARIARQRGRIAAALHDWPEATKSYNAAIRMLKENAVANAGTDTEPVIAETELEYAGIFAQSGSDPAAVRTQYGAAVDSMIDSRGTGSVLPSGIGAYFDLLVDEARHGAKPDTDDRFFRAMQAAGEPAVARQLSQLQRVITSSPALAQASRDRDEAKRELTRLREAINALPADATVDAKQKLDAARADEEAKLAAADAVLARDPRFQAVDDSPATVAEVRAALRPGEGFLKVIALSDRIYGIYISPDETFIYPVAATIGETDRVEALAAAVRTSIDGRLRDKGEIVPFDEKSANALFEKLVGPARAALLKASALVVDPAGPLETLPIGVLVTRLDPTVKRADAFDFSKTAFLAGQLDISTAVSPRSFLVARKLPETHATHALLGLGEHRPPPAGADSNAMVKVGYACSAPFATIAEQSRESDPISAKELTTAATALGVPNAPMVTDAAFSDDAIKARSDLADYQVLHFATHGLEEGQWGCDKSPPALVTSFGGAQSDGVLSISEIADLHLDANLVVLSACDTAAGIDAELARASGQEEAGSTLAGLVRAFLAANARAVMATYWSVSAEDETDDLIATFYHSARTKTIGEALRDAQLELMHRPEYSHPFYWGAYFVVGDSNKPLLTGDAGAKVRSGR